MAARGLRVQTCTDPIRIYTKIMPTHYLDSLYAKKQDSSGRPAPRIQAYVDIAYNITAGPGRWVTCPFKDLPGEYRSAKQSQLITAMVQRNISVQTRSVGSDLCIRTVEVS
jgi:hypothetical protein